MNILDQLHLNEIQRNPAHLLSVTNPSKELLRAAIDEHPYNINYINDPSEELLMLALHLLIARRYEIY